MARKNTVGFTFGDGFRLGMGFLFAQLIFAFVIGVLWFAGVAALFGLAAVAGPR